MRLAGPPVNSLQFALLSCGLLRAFVVELDCDGVVVLGPAQRAPGPVVRCVGLVSAVWRVAWRTRCKHRAGGSERIVSSCCLPARWCSARLEGVTATTAMRRKPARRQHGGSLSISLHLSVSATLHCMPPPRSPPCRHHHHTYTYTRARTRRVHGSATYLGWSMHRCTCSYTVSSISRASGWKEPIELRSFAIA